MFVKPISCAVPKAGRPANRDRLEHEQDPLTQAHCAVAIPLAGLKGEQDRTLGELDLVNRRLDAPGSPGKRQPTGTLAHLPATYQVNPTDTDQNPTRPGPNNPRFPIPLVW